jgi:hypothetical protein
VKRECAGAFQVPHGRGSKEDDPSRIPAGTRTRRRGNASLDKRLRLVPSGRWQRIAVSRTVYQRSTSPLFWMILPESGNACARDRDLHMEGLRKTSSRTHSAEPVAHLAQGDDRNCLAGRRGRRIYLLGACGETGPASKEMMMTTRRQLQASSMRRLSEALTL